MTRDETVDERDDDASTRTERREMTTTDDSRVGIRSRAIGRARRAAR